MKRRDLLTGSLAAVTGGAAVAKAAPGLTQQAPSCAPCAPAVFPPAPSARAKLRIKPVMTNMIHSGVWEGPCRFNVITVAQETENVRRTYDGWTKALQRGDYTFGPGADLLDPTLITFNEDFTLPAAALAELDRDARSADVLFIAPYGSSNAAFDLVHRFHKPGILFGLDCRTVDVAAYAKSQGDEIHVTQDKDELRLTVDLLRVRKIFRETRVLFPTNRGFPSVASLTGVTSLQELETAQGVKVTTVPLKALADVMESTLADRAACERADIEADSLIRNAAQSYISRDYVARSLLFKRAVTGLMDLHGCNAFTIECFEFCASRLPEKWKITPCLIHTLFKDEGIASSCEGDMGALLAMRLLMSVSGKSSHLGNMFLRDRKTVEVNHSAPGIKMNGFDQPAMAYKLGRFVQSGWGTKAVVDFMRNDEKRVTVARMHPNAKQLLLLKGKLVAAGGWEKDELGCSVAAFIQPAESGNGEAFVRRQTEYGNHLVWVYGDYTEPLRSLGPLMGIEVEVIS